MHRDLKPANVKVSNDGRVKVLDFGLAKVVEDSKTSADLTQSPTMPPGGNRTGCAAGDGCVYEPEQARGLFVDRRTDLWAFGCVLYESCWPRGGSRVGRSPTLLQPSSKANRTGACCRHRRRPQCADPRTMPPEGFKRRIRDIGDVRTELSELTAGLAGRSSRSHDNATMRSRML